MKSARNALAQAAQRCGISLGGRAAFGKRVLNAILIGVPLTGSVYSVTYFRNHPPGWIEWSCLILFYSAVGIGIGVGFHRGFTHQSFRPTPPVKFWLLFFGSLACQGSAVRWVADHRRHHRFADHLWDTHSPYAIRDSAIRSRWFGLYHAHLGWMFDNTTTNYREYVPDLLKDRMMMAFHYGYLPLTVATFALPYLYGWLLGGPEAGVGCLLMGGCVRTTLFHHITWGVNSIGHSFGDHDVHSRDESRNHAFLALMTFGEGWHNNHHSAPRLACNHWKPHQLDWNGQIILAMGRMNLVSQIVTAEAEHSSEMPRDAIVQPRLESNGQQVA